MRKIKHGFLGRVIYEREEFKEVPPSTEERRRQLQEKLKPWSFDPNKPLFSGGKGYGEAPTPSIPVEVSIDPSSAVQYENVILSASTTGTSPTFIWTLTDFYNTSDVSVSSYTGQTLTEGYFSSTGSSNVSVSVVCDEGEGSTSTFSVSEFDPSTIATLDVWYDPSDTSAITFRTGTDYVESLANKGNTSNLPYVNNTTAAEQPLLSASSINNNLNVLYGDGLSTILFNTNGATRTVNGRTLFLLTRLLDKSTVPGSAGNFMQLYDNYNNSNARRYAGGNIVGGSYSHNQAYFQGLSITIPEEISYSWMYEDNTQAEGEYNGSTSWSRNSQSKGYGKRIYSIMAGYPKEWYLYGEFCEMLEFDSVLDIDTINQIDRYIQYKWFGSMTY